MRNPKASYTIRIIAGAYVVYLAYKIGRGPFIGETSFSLPVALLIALIMGGFGVFFVINGLQGYKILKEEEEAAEAARAEEEAEEQPEEPEEEVAEESPEEVPAEKTAPSIMQRAAMPAHLRVDEDETGE